MRDVQSRATVHGSGRPPGGSRHIIRMGRDREHVQGALSSRAEGDESDRSRLTRTQRLSQGRTAAGH